MLFDYCQAQLDVDTAVGSPVDFSVLGKGNKGKGDKKGNSKGKRGKGEGSKGKKDKGKGKGKRQSESDCLQSLGPHEKGLLVEREQQEREGRRISGDSDYVSCKNTTEPPITWMLIQSDGDAVPVAPTKRMYSVTKYESSPNDFLKAATSVCQQSLADSLGSEPSGSGVELKSASGHQFTTTGNTTMCLRTRDGINVSRDVQIAPKKT